MPFILLNLFCSFLSLHLFFHYISSEREGKKHLQRQSKSDTTGAVMHSFCILDICISFPPCPSQAKNAERLEREKQGHIIMRSNYFTRAKVKESKSQGKYMWNTIWGIKINTEIPCSEILSLHCIYIQKKMPKVQREYKLLIKGNLLNSLSNKGGWQKIRNSLAGVVIHSGRLLKAAYTKREKHI